MQRNNPSKIATPFKTKITLIIFGVFLFFLLLETGLRLGGFIILSLQEHGNRLSLMQKDTYRILCLGESTTQGQYPPFLAEALNRHNINIKFSVIDKGVPGTNTAAIASKLESDLDAYHPDMVITMMGINDWGPYAHYDPVSDSKAINFLKSLRIYKLTRLLWLHAATRILHRKIELQPVAAEKNNVPQSQDLANLKKAIALEPRNEEAYVALGWLYLEQKKFSEAEGSFKKATELNPKKGTTHDALGWLYYEQNRFSEAEGSFKKATELNPKNDTAYVALGRLYLDQNRFSEAEGSFKKAIELNPKNDTAYVELGRYYRNQSKFSLAEESCKKAIELNPGNEVAYSELARFYREEGKFSLAEESCNKAIALNPKNDWMYGALEVLYLENKNIELSRKFGKKARDLRLEYYSMTTMNNYHRLKAILNKRGITYVCVQYPMRSITSLKKIFAGQPGIIFVDNERLFKDAVKGGGYNIYFRDAFGGDFGHCTPKGNKLLAENIANVILKEVFYK